MHKRAEHEVQNLHMQAFHFVNLTCGGCVYRYLGLMMISQLGGSCLPKRVASVGRKSVVQFTGHDWGSAASKGLLVSTKGGAWQFRDPQPDIVGADFEPADACSMQCAANFSFSLLRQC